MLYNIGKKAKLPLGFTLIEVIVGVTLLGILVALALPSYQNIIDNSHLRNLTETLYSDLKYAHTESIAQRSDMYVSFQAGNSWCYGLSDSGACDCNVSNSCQVGGVEKVVNSTEYTGFSQSTTGFGGSADLGFEGFRGMADNAGSISFLRNGKLMTVKVNKMGQLSVCSIDVPGYKPC